MRVSARRQGRSYPGPQSSRAYTSAALKLLGVFAVACRFAFRSRGCAVSDLATGSQIPLKWEGGCNGFSI